ncbi:MAG: hypothetical protein QOJ91_1266 [Sphingomonadales bacterium]|jgi:hypothetical protein|nr:hypothetical protein [Sphingomonadales bacterium]
MRKSALAAMALALSLSACGGGNKSADDANALGADNMMTDDSNLMMDSNSAVNQAMDAQANGSVNASTANMMVKDATTNDADTNLANGL